MDVEWQTLGRLVIALVLSGALGWERSAAGKAAGLRTHMLVGAGAALFVALGNMLVLAFQSFGELMRFDPTRVLEAVVAGVSFLGAGTIFFTRQHGRVHGLTTAASIWTTAAVGMAAGLGRYVVAVGTTLILLVVLHGLLWVENREDRLKKQRPAG